MGRKAYNIEFILFFFILSILIQFFETRSISCPILNDRRHPRMNQSQRASTRNQRSQGMPLYKEKRSLPSTFRVLLLTTRREGIGVRLGLRGDLSDLPGSLIVLQNLDPKCKCCETLYYPLLKKITSQSSSISVYLEMRGDGGGGGRGGRR